MLLAALVVGCSSGSAGDPAEAPAPRSLEALLFRAGDLGQPWTESRDDATDETNLDKLVLECLRLEELEPVEHVAGPNLHGKDDERIIYTFANRWPDARQRDRILDLASSGIDGCLPEVVGSRLAGVVPLEPTVPRYEPMLYRWPDGTSMGLGVTCVELDCVWIQFAPALRLLPATQLRTLLEAARERHDGGAPAQ